MFGETWKNEATTITKQKTNNNNNKRGGGQIYIFSILEIAFQVDDI